ncbi:Tubulin alpha-2 chain [Gryllus bimaculatus]|nr:Tubulin alpha-2 chain [Gryllus bimaculatus]
MVDNEAITHICRRNWILNAPRITKPESLKLPRYVSSITGSLRFERPLNVDLTEFKPIWPPRIHVPLANIRPGHIRRESLPRAAVSCGDSPTPASSLPTRWECDPRHGKYMPADMHVPRRCGPKRPVLSYMVVGEGMEEGEFSEAREDLAALEKDYEEVGMDSVEGEGEGAEEY